MVKRLMLLTIISISFAIMFFGGVGADFGECIAGGDGVTSCDDVAISFDQTTCDAQVGCTWTSSSSSCAEDDEDCTDSTTYDTQTTCEAQAGCAWDGTSSVCAEDANDCTDSTTYDTQTTCEAQAGCAWFLGGSTCDGTATLCTDAPVDVDKLTCEAQFGCAWRPQVCTDSDSSRSQNPYFVAGNVTVDGSVVGIDVCDIATANLTEYSCNSDGSVKSNYIICDDGCEGTTACKAPVGAQVCLAENTLLDASTKSRQNNATGTYYCDFTLDWEPVKVTYSSSCDPATDNTCTDDEDVSTSPAACVGDYECASNSCVDGLCFSVSEALAEQRGILIKIWCVVTNLGDYLGANSEGSIIISEVTGEADFISRGGTTTAGAATNKGHAYSVCLDTAFT